MQRKSAVTTFTLVSMHAHHNVTPHPRPSLLRTYVFFPGTTLMLGKTAAIAITCGSGILRCTRDSRSLRHFHGEFTFVGSRHMRVCFLPIAGTAMAAPALQWCNVPLSIEPNTGQASAEVRYLAGSNSYTL